MANRELFSIIISNFFGYDFIIFLLAVLGCFLLVKTNTYANRLYALLNPQSWLPGGEESLQQVQERFHAQKLSEEEMIRLRRKTNLYYTLLDNTTTVFPLLGILGTVVSLIGMIGTMGEAASQQQFFAALTSTFWGIVFAIIFKSCASYVSTRIEDNDKNMQIFLERNTALMREDMQRRLEA